MAKLCWVIKDGLWSLRRTDSGGDTSPTELGVFLSPLSIVLTIIWLLTRFYSRYYYTVFILWHLPLFIFVENKMIYSSLSLLLTWHFRWYKKNPITWHIDLINIRCRHIEYITQWLRVMVHKGTWLRVEELKKAAREVADWDMILVRALWRRMRVERD